MLVIRRWYDWLSWSTYNFNDFSAWNENNLSHNIIYMGFIDVPKKSMVDFTWESEHRQLRKSW